MLGLGGYIFGVGVVYWVWGTIRLWRRTSLHCWTILIVVESVCDCFSSSSLLLSSLELSDTKVYAP